MSVRFFLIGGDARQLFLADLLRRDGHIVETSALSDESPDFSRLSQSDCVLLPMPLLGRNDAIFAPLCPTPVSLHAVLNHLAPTQTIFAGKVGPDVHKQAAALGLTIHDILLREELAVANAVPTAEGALQIAMEHLPTTIHQSRILVAGFGRVGQCTAQRFRALGAEVWVCARAPGQLALAENMGLHTISLQHMPQLRKEFDLLINTVPATIFTRTKLEPLGRPLLMELASPPGGFDHDAVRDLNLTLISAPGLPGKAAPLTAAHIIQKTIYRMLEELDF